jgi:hypothetical protein
MVIINGGECRLFLGEDGVLSAFRDSSSKL